METEFWQQIVRLGGLGWYVEGFLFSGGIIFSSLKESSLIRLSDFLDRAEINSTHGMQGDQGESLEVCPHFSSSMARTRFAKQEMK